MLNAYVTEIQIPPETEDKIVFIIDYVVKRLMKKFVFGYYELDDAFQEGRTFALEALASGKYQPHRPLEKFLYVHILRRFINLRRNKLRRAEVPCNGCPFFNRKAKTCNVFDSKKDCPKFARWEKRNADKSNLMNLKNNLAAVLLTDDSSDFVGGIERREILGKIAEGMPDELLSSYTKLTNGSKLKPEIHYQILNVVSGILGTDLFTTYGG